MGIIIDYVTGEILKGAAVIGATETSKGLDAVLTKTRSTEKVPEKAGVSVIICCIIAASVASELKTSRVRSNTGAYFIIHYLGAYIVKYIGQEGK